MDQEERKEREASDGSGGAEGAGSKRWIRRNGRSGKQAMDQGATDGSWTDQGEIEEAMD